MNILLISGKSIYSRGSIGGAETSLSLIAEKLSGLGNSVIYFTKGSSRFPSLKKIKSNGVTCYLFTALALPLARIAAFNRLSAAFNALQKILLICYLSNKYHIDLVYSWGLSTSTYEAIEARRFFKLKYKIITRLAGVRDNVTKASEYNRLEYVFNNVDAVNYQSSYHKETYLAQLKEFNLPMPRSEEIICDIGIKDIFFSRPLKGRRNGKNIFFLCAARFSYPKRQDLLIEAIHLMPRKNFKLLFFGEGDTLPAVRNLVSRYHLEDMIQFNRTVSQEELIPILRDATCLLHPVDYEPQSKLVFESMALGTPVICSNVPTLNNLLINFHSGILVGNSVDFWKNILERAVEGDIDFESISRNAFEYVSSVADSRKNILKYNAYFRNLIGSQNKI